MKNAKRIICILCTGITALSLAGCSKKSDSNSKEYVARTRSEADAQSAAENSGVIEMVPSNGAWKSMKFTLDGSELTFQKLKYSDIQSAGWSFDPEVYGMENLSAEKGRFYEKSINLTKDGTGDGVFTVGLTNFGDEPCGLDEICVWVAEFNAENKTNYPEVVLEGDITWGANQEAITAAYGDPSATQRLENTRITKLTYMDNEGRSITLSVSDINGLQNILFEFYA